MKKRLLVLFPILLCPTLTACQDTAHSITCINVGFSDQISIELSIENFENLVASKQPFAVEFYSPYCGHCEDLEELVNKYIDQTRNLIYRCDLSVLNSEEFEEFKAKYSDIIVDNYVPALRFVNDGHLTFDVSRAKFESYTALRSILSKHFLSSHLTMVSTKEGFDKYLESKATYVAFAYDLDNINSLTKATSYLINQDFAKTDWNVLLLNCKDFAANLGEIKNYYNTELDTFIVKMKNGQVEKIADYSASDFNFDSFIN